MQSHHHHAPKLVILGRDGILNVFRPDHVKGPHEWIPIEGALEAVARLNQAGAKRRVDQSQRPAKTRGSSARSR